MQTKQSKDKIDMELSRTYFGDPGAKGKKENQNPFLHQDKPKFFSPVMVTLLVLVVILIAFFVFLVRKNVSLEVNINVEAVPTMQKSASKTSSGLLAPWQKEKALSAINRTAPLKNDEKILYGFEEDTDGWDIPGWTSDKEEYVAKTLDRTSAAASEGRYSLKMATEFPGTRWAGAIIEVQHYLDLGDYNFISIDVLVPKEAPKGLQAKLILTVGESWKFVEMSRGVNLKPGEWTSVKASLSAESTDWKRTIVDDTFKKDVRKIALRVESNNIPYTGPVYIDDLRLSK